MEFKNPSFYPSAVIQVPPKKCSISFQLSLCSPVHYFLGMLCKNWHRSVDNSCECCTETGNNREKNLRTGAKWGTMLRKNEGGIIVMVVKFAEMAFLKIRLPTHKQYSTLLYVVAHDWTQKRGKARNGPLEKRLWNVHLISIKVNHYRHFMNNAQADVQACKYKHVCGCIYIVLYMLN